VEGLLGLTNNVVQQMLANLTSLGCVGPTVALRQFEHCALLAELEATVAAAVDELVELLKKKVKKQVTKVVSEMAKFPTPAAPRRNFLRRRCSDWCRVRRSRRDRTCGLEFSSSSGCRRG